MPSSPGTLYDSLIDDIARRGDDLIDCSAVLKIVMDIEYSLKPGTPLTAEEIAMIEAARDLPPTEDEDNPEIDPVATPELYAALICAVLRRNQRFMGKEREE